MGLILLCSIICNLLLTILYYFASKKLDKMADQYIKMNHDWSNYCKDINCRWSEICSRIKDEEKNDNISATDEF